MASCFLCCWIYSILYTVYSIKYEHVFDSFCLSMCWTGYVVILRKFSLLAALEVVKMTTSSAASDENFLKISFLVQCSYNLSAFIWFFYPYFSGLLYVSGAIVLWYTLCSEVTLKDMGKMAVYFNTTKHHKSETTFIIPGMYSLRKWISQCILFYIIIYII